jgi:cytochrome c oxidase assembly factor CtaG
MAAVVSTFVIALAGGVYLHGWLHRRSIPVWRACNFFLGLLAFWVAVVWPIASFDRHMLTAHMIQHTLLMTIAPPLIWLGEPVMTAWPKRWALPEGLSKLLGNPAFCWLASASALIVWHVPAMFQLGMESSAWHFIEHASFVTTGLLFWWPVIEPWPSVARWPRSSMLLYLFLATLPCDVLSGLLVFSDRVVYPMYMSMPHTGGLSPLEDQQCAAALMWTCVTIVFLVAGTILSMQMLSPKPRPQETVSV